ncbi:MAG: prepilin-type N-terminal cleavage/methylation domain-containing protein [Elusimicrobia bacterium]|nr:prepilin-type N-terminal cleavage/methylation domain-containing protein [Elusimicrobiota bacterium]
MTAMRVGKRSPRPGFALVELLIAMALFAIIAVGLLSFQSMVLGGHSRALNSSALGNSVTAIRRAFTVALQEASYVSLPSAGSSAPAFTALSNCEDDGATPLAAGPAGFSHICLDAAGKNIFIYRGAAPVPAIVCGQDPGAGVTRALVAGGRGLRVNTIRFNRPSSVLVQLDLGLETVPAAAGLPPARKDLQLQGVISHALD